MTCQPNRFSEFTPTSSSMMPNRISTNHEMIMSTSTQQNTNHHNDLTLLAVIREDYVRLLSLNHLSWTGQDEILFSTQKNKNDDVKISLREILDQALQIVEETESMLADLDNTFDD
jgi:hypothetical protein